MEKEPRLWCDVSIDGGRGRDADAKLKELVLKRGGDDTVVVVENETLQIAVDPVAQVMDTTAAGDTFNAGYLATRLQCANAAEAARKVNRCAGIVIQHLAGVIPKKLFSAELSSQKSNRLSNHNQGSED